MLNRLTRLANLHSFRPPIHNSQCLCHSMSATATDCSRGRPGEVCCTPLLAGCRRSIQGCSRTTGELCHTSTHSTITVDVVTKTTIVVALMISLILINIDMSRIWLTQATNLEETKTAVSSSILTSSHAHLPTLLTDHSCLT
jgi:hypothetical protein